jgi:hypothetical protein
VYLEKWKEGLMIEAGRSATTEHGVVLGMRGKMGSKCLIISNTE